MSNSDVLKTIKDEDVEYVDIRFTDPRGKLQHVTIMSDQVDEDFLAMNMLKQANVLLLNQAVILKDVNDTVDAQIDRKSVV